MTRRRWHRITECDDASTPPARRRPAGTCRAKLTPGRRLVQSTLVLAQRIAPPSIDPLVDKGLGTAVPECTAKRHRSRCVRLHVVETAMFQYCRPRHRIDPHPQKVRYAPDLAGHVGFEIIEVQQQKIGQFAYRPPGTHILPQIGGGERIAVALQPCQEILAR